MPAIQVPPPSGTATTASRPGLLQQAGADAGVVLLCCRLHSRSASAFAVLRRQEHAAAPTTIVAKPTAAPAAPAAPSSSPSPERTARPNPEPKPADTTGDREACRRPAGHGSACGHDGAAAATIRKPGLWRRRRSRSRRRSRTSRRSTWPPTTARAQAEARHREGAQARRDADRAEARRRDGTQASGDRHGQARQEADQGLGRSVRQLVVCRRDGLARCVGATASWLVAIAGAEVARVDFDARFLSDGRRRSRRAAAVDRAGGSRRRGTIRSAGGERARGSSGERSDAAARRPSHQPRRNPRPHRHCRRPPPPRRYGDKGSIELGLGLGYSSETGFVGAGGLGAVLRRRPRRARGRGDLRRGGSAASRYGVLLGSLRLVPLRFSSIAIAVTARGGRVLSAITPTAGALGGAASMLFLFSPTVGLELGYESLWLLPGRPSAPISTAASSTARSSPSASDSEPT